MGIKKNNPGCTCVCDCGGTCLNGSDEEVGTGPVSQIDMIIDGLPTEIFFGKGVLNFDNFLALTAANLEGTYSIIESECFYQSTGILDPADFSLRGIDVDSCDGGFETSFPLTIDLITYTARWDLQPYNLPGVGAFGLELIIFIRIPIFGGFTNAAFRFVPDGLGMRCAGGELTIDAGAGETAPCGGYENPSIPLSTYELFS